MNGCKKNGGKRIGAGRKGILPLPHSNIFEETWQKIDTSLIKGVDGTTIAQRLGVSPKTFYRYGELCKRWGKHSELGIVDFTAYKQVKREIGNAILLERQFDTAVGIYDQEKKQFIIPPNISMLIWLGKVRLGQSDKVNTNPKERVAIKRNLIIEVVNNTNVLLQKAT